MTQPAEVRRYQTRGRSTDTFGRVLISARDQHLIVDGPDAQTMGARKAMELQQHLNEEGLSVTSDPGVIANALVALATVDGSPHQQGLYLPGTASEAQLLLPCERQDLGQEEPTPARVADSLELHCPPSSGRTFLRCRHRDRGAVGPCDVGITMACRGPGGN